MSKAVVLLLGLALETVRGLTFVAYHRICCFQRDPIALLAPEPGADLVDDWTATLRQLNGVNCLHKYGFVEYDSRQLAARNDGAELPPDSEWNFIVNDSLEQRNRPSLKTASCAAIRMSGQTFKPLRPFFKFLTPDLLDLFTNRQPIVIVETGSATRDGLTLKAYKIRDAREYDHRKVQGIQRTFADQADRKSVVTRDMVSVIANRLSTKQLQGTIQFLEWATRSRCPNHPLVFEEDLNGLMTIEKLKSLNIAKMMSKLKKSVNVSENNFDWFKAVPVLHLGFKLPEKKRSHSKSMRNSKRRSSFKEAGELADLSFIADENASDRLLRMLTNGTLLGAIRAKPVWLSDSQLAAANQRTRAASHQVAEYLLVNNLFAVSRSSYEKAIALAARDQLVESSNAVHTICSPLIETMGVDNRRDWLTDNYRFYAEAPTSSSFVYGSIEKFKKPTDNRSLQCLILAFPRVDQEAYESLPHQLLDVLFALVKRDRDTGELLVEKAHWSNDVDVWKVLGGDQDEVLSVLLNKVGRRIQETGIWDPQ